MTHTHALLRTTEFIVFQFSRLPQANDGGDSSGDHLRLHSCNFCSNFCRALDIILQPDSKLRIQWTLDFGRLDIIVRNCMHCTSAVPTTIDFNFVTRRWTQLSSKRSTPFVFAVVALFFTLCSLQAYVLRVTIVRMCKITFTRFGLFDLFLFLLMLFRLLLFYHFRSNSSAATNYSHCSDEMHHRAANRMQFNREIELYRCDSDDSTRTEKMFFQKEKAVISSHSVSL